MRVLVTCDRYPSPRHEGLVLRIFHYVRHLRHKHEFDLICLKRPGQLHDEEIESCFHEVTCIPYPPVLSPKGIGRLISAFDVNGLYPNSASIRETIGTALSRKRYDLIWDAGSNMLLNLNTVRGSLPLLADQVDDAFLDLDRQLELATGLRKRFWLMKQKMLQKRFARRFLAPANAILFVSAVDEYSFRQVCPQANAVTIANGVDENYFFPTTSEPSGFNGRVEVVFEGVMCFPPNVDAAHHFVKEILPLAATTINGIHFSLVGRDPAPTLLQLRSPDIEVTGFVEDIRPWLDQAHVFVCPMRTGAGIKNKILQAWAMGKAVISTPEGAHGLEIHDGENILICASPKQFADGIVSLISDPEKRRRMGIAARRTVENHYSWKSKAAELDALFSSIYNG